ncbi:hypothetical protein [Clostridium sp.]
MEYYHMGIGSLSYKQEDLYEEDSIFFVALFCMLTILITDPTST